MWRFSPTALAALPLHLPTRIIRPVVAFPTHQGLPRAKKIAGLFFAQLRFILPILPLCIPATHATAQETASITGDRLSGFVLPIEPIAADIDLGALRGTSWTIDDTKCLLLQGDVKVEIGSYSLVSDKALVWINRIPSAAGTINQIAVYFDKVGDPAKQAGLGVKGTQLLVTGSTRGEVKLALGLLEEKKPPRDPFIARGEARLAEYLQRLIAQPPPLQNRPQLQEPQKQPDFQPVPGGTVHEQDLKLPKRMVLPPTQTATPWLASPTGVVRFGAEKIEVSRGEQENTITALGSVVFDYLPDKTSQRVSQLTLTAERAVIFAKPGPLESMSGSMDAKSILGVYLEGNVSAVAQNGEYVVRAPRMYYDFLTQKAIMVNSLLRLQRHGTRVPVYARALEMRQLAQNQWSAKDSTVSTSEFFTPHLAIGSDRASITQTPTPESEGGGMETSVEAHGNTMQLGGVPIFPWPDFQGDVEKVPLRRLEVGTRNNDGVRMLTTWDLYTLMGIKPPAGVEADLEADGFTSRGAALGFGLRYDVGDSQGRIDLYGLYDQGIDRTSSGFNVQPDDVWRGMAVLEHQTKLSEYWSVQAQLSLISDETFITAWRENEFNERREFESSLYLKYQRENSAFTILGKYSFEDFLSNSYLLASRQYAVDKLPEITYRRYGDSLFGDAVTYSTENRLTRMSLVFEHATPGEIGVRNGAFGIPRDMNISDFLKARGLRENWVDRFDSRHELALPLHPGIFNVTPFIVGRFTGYDDDFHEFSSDSDSLRFFGAAGVRINTQFQHIDNAAESRLFDIHRLRHLVEPYVTLWSAYASVKQDDLPIFDEEVESLASGSAVELGLRNTWQTQRGGPGRWRSVDVFTLDTAIVLDSEGKPNESPTPQFFDYRPEYSQMGNHIRAQATWLLSDSLSVVGETTYVLDTSTFARGAIGVELRHSPLLTTYVEYRYIDADKNELLSVGWVYQLTPKYQVMVSPQYDFRVQDLRSITTRLTRSFPDFDFTLEFRYDQISNITSFGASLKLAQF